MPYNIRLRRNDRERIEKLVEAGEYDSVADFIHEAISHHLRYIEERDFRQYLMSEKGRNRINEIARTEPENEKLL